MGGKLLNWQFAIQPSLQHSLLWKTLCSGERKGFEIKLIASGVPATQMLPGGTGTAATGGASQHSPKASTHRDSDTASSLPGPSNTAQQKQPQTPQMSKPNSSSALSQAPVVPAVHGGL